MRVLRNTIVLVAAVVALAAPAVAHASGPMFVGAVENAPLQTNLVAAKAKVDLAKLAGFDALRIVVFWGPGRASIVPDWDLQVLKNAATAAQLDGIRLIVSVSNYNSRTTPRTARNRQQFAIYTATLARELPSVTDFIVGNEPNLNLFWMPQFTKPVYKTVVKKVRVKGRLVKKKVVVTVTKKVRVKGKLVKKKVPVVAKPPQDAAAPAYELLLAQTYDALKAVNPLINVIGVALSPRGGDNPTGKRQTHSPTTFLLDLGKAYRATHRTKPLMDAFAMHPYLEKSSLPPTFAHPKSKSIGLADYPKLVKLLRKAFKGTSQPASTLPIVYDEFGVQTKIPSGKTSQYFNLRSRPAQDVVPESTQAKYYDKALQMAYCQPNVMGMLLFHVSDERNAKAWQSGLFYADDTPKSSLDPVRGTIDAIRDGTLSSCSGADFAAALKSVTFPKPPATPATYTTNDTDWSADISCVKRCSYYAKIESFPSGEEVVAEQSDLDPDVPAKIQFPKAPLAPGQYRMVVRVWQYGKLGTTVVRTGTPFVVALPPIAPAPPPPMTPPPTTTPPAPGPATTPPAGG